MTNSFLLDRISNDEVQNLTNDQLEMVFGGANEKIINIDNGKCRLLGNPKKGNYQLHCWQYGQS